MTYPVPFVVSTPFKPFFQRHLLPARKASPDCQETETNACITRADGYPASSPEELEAVQGGLERQNTPVMSLLF
jgi:hypothetical protein